MQSLTMHSHSSTYNISWSIELGKIPLPAPPHVVLPRHPSRSLRHPAPRKPRLTHRWCSNSIDGVLLRSSTPIPGATEALRYLQRERIPFILLTNGGGKSEAERVADLQAKLDVPLDTSLFVQSHTPFADFTQYHDKTVLVVGGDGDRCRAVAEGYGFRDVVTPADLYVAEPEIWPFSAPFREYYERSARPLPRPVLHDAAITAVKPGGDASRLKIDAIFVYNDPRDWGLDATVILDTLLSRQGYLGTRSAKNGDRTLPNNGYQQDGQPPLYYSNPDLLWASAYPLSRLGQGGFRTAFEGVWRAVTDGATLSATVLGKPSQDTYAFAERRLRAHRKHLFGNVGLNDPLRRVFMVGDNPESDIAGANGYRSEFGSKWTSVLIKTGVWREGAPLPHVPHTVQDDVLSAVMWAVEEAKREAAA